MGSRTGSLGLACVLLCSAVAGRAWATNELIRVDAAEPQDIRDRWGIEIQAVRVSAAGMMIDFRYKILDAEKAAAVTRRENRPYLIDQVSHAKLLVPSVPKIGPLRQSALKPLVGRVYGVMFSNPAQIVKAGSKVAVVIGDCRIDNLTVE